VNTMIRAPYSNSWRVDGASHDRQEARVGARVGLSTGLALGWDGPVEGRMATSAALRVGYVHIPEHEEVKEDFFELSVQVARTKY